MMKENLQLERKTINFLEQGNIFKHAGDHTFLEIQHLNSLLIIVLLVVMIICTMNHNRKKYLALKKLHASPFK